MTTLAAPEIAKVHYGEFIVTPHARKRIAERLGIKERKMEKFLKKAWESKEVLGKTNRLEYRSPDYGGEPRIYKSIMGHVLIFVIHEGVKVLITFV